jgi:hypothetical protein
MTTLTDIRNFMLSTFATIQPENDDYYDDDGHCGDGLYMEIIGFWNDFKTDKDFEYLVSARWQSDDLDLEGARSYLLSHDKLYDMVFDYMYNNLKWSLTDYESKIYNTCDFTDEICDRYSNIDIIRNDKIKGIIENVDAHKEQNLKSSNKSTGQVSSDTQYLVMKYPSSMKSKLDNIPGLQYLGESRLDSKMIIYKVPVIPQGELVPSISF